MYRCICSQWTLDACLHDIALLVFRARAPPVYLQRRRFGLRRPLLVRHTPKRELELAAVSSSLDDAIIPFEVTSTSWATLAHVREDAEPRSESAPEWEPEVDARPKTILTSIRRDISQEKLPSPGPVKDEKQLDARKARKLRRMNAGTFKPNVQASSKEDALNEQLHTVLKKIEALHSDVPHKQQLDESSKMPALNTQKTLPVRENIPTKSNPPLKKPKKEQWQIQKAALEEKFKGAGWQPPKRLSPDTMEGIRALRQSDPNTYTTGILADHFRVSPEVIRRILKSKWRPSEDEAEDRRERWLRRGVRKWQELAEQGVKPPRKWREMGVGSIHGAPDEKPPWKRGGRRKRDEEHPSWDSVINAVNQDDQVRREDSMAERLL